MIRARTPDSDGAISSTATQPAAARRWAWMLGFCLPLSGGLPLSRWIPGFVDQVTPARLVTFAALAWLLLTAFRSRQGWSLPEPSRRMAKVVIASLAYALVTLLWTPSLSHGIHDLLAVTAALGSGLVLLLLVRRDRDVLASFAAGVVWAGALQVILAIIEITTRFHFSTQFGSVFMEQRHVSTLEEVFGPIAFGTMGNPNDLGGFMLLALAVFLNAKAFGLVLSAWVRRVGWFVVAVAALVGVSALNDARGFRLGFLLLLAISAMDRLLPKGPVALRVPGLLLFAMGALFLTLLNIEFAFPSNLGGFSPGTGVSPPPPPVIGQSDSLRLDLIWSAMAVAIGSFGFGRGLGTERAMIDAGQLPLNFHNVVAQMAAELGFVIAIAFLAYLVVIVVGWAFLGRVVRSFGLEVSRARATLAVMLLLNGVTSSGVLESPAYWGMFAALPLLTVGADVPDLRPDGASTTILGKAPWRPRRRESA